MNTDESSRWRAALLGCLMLPLMGTWAAEIRWQAPVEVARGAGERGAWRQSESRYDFVDDPAVAWSPKGDLAIAWTDQRRKAVLLQRYSADGKALPGARVDVSRQPATFSWLPRLAFASDDADRLHVLWQEIIFSGGSHGGEILFAASNDHGRSFAPPLNLSRSGRATARAVSTATSGTTAVSTSPWHRVVWCSPPGPSTTAGSGWPDPAMVVATSPNAYW